MVYVMVGTISFRWYWMFLCSKSNPAATNPESLTAFLSVVQRSIQVVD